MSSSQNSSQTSSQTSSQDPVRADILTSNQVSGQNLSPAITMGNLQKVINSYGTSPNFQSDVLKCGGNYTDAINNNNGVLFVDKVLRPIHEKIVEKACSVDTAGIYAENIIDVPDNCAKLPNVESSINDLKGANVILNTKIDSMTQHIMNIESTQNDFVDKKNTMVLIFFIVIIVFLIIIMYLVVSR
jgi:hypothetical protein